MAKGQHLSKYQQGIVNRYYQHQGTIYLTKLQELTSNLAVAEPGKQADKMWKSAAEYLTKSGIDAASVDAVASKRDLKVLAQFVGDLAANKTPKLTPKQIKDMKAT